MPKLCRQSKKPLRNRSVPSPHCHRQCLQNKPAKKIMCTLIDKIESVRFENPNRSYNRNDGKEENEKRLFQIIFIVFLGCMKIEFFSDSFKYGQRNSNDDFFQNTLNGVQNTLRVFQNILRVSQNTLRVLQNILRVSQNTLRVF